MIVNMLRSIYRVPFSKQKKFQRELTTVIFEVAAFGEN